MQTPWYFPDRPIEKSLYQMPHLRSPRLTHLSNEVVDGVLSVTEISALNEVLELPGPEAARGAIELERPQEVRGLLEIGSAEM